MAWNPETYNSFQTERFAPFYDLVALVKIRNGMDVIDLGCGTGELTGKLAAILPEANVLGIDSSEEMLNDCKRFENKNLHFNVNTIENQVLEGSRWDLVFSNAALQWVLNHEDLLPALAATLKSGGQLLVQMPAQQHNVSNIMLNNLANEEPFRSSLNNWQMISPVLEIEEYAGLLFRNGGKEITVYEKVYPLILKNADAVFNWVSGTALIPNMEKLDGDNKEEFIREYRVALEKTFPSSPVFYPFKRIILSAIF